MALEKAMPAAYPLQTERTPQGRQFSQRASSTYIMEQTVGFVNTALALR
jgi:hypothetical protein